MTGLELRTQFVNLVDDSFDVTHIYQLLTQAKNYIEDLYKLKMLEDVDITQIASPGDTYLTMKNLPTTWRSTNKLLLGRYEYFPIPFNKREIYQASARRYYINHKASQYALTGKVGTVQQINHYFQTTTPDITEDNEEQDVIVWPSRFHGILPYQAAKVYQANIDADIIVFRMSPQQEVEFQRLLDGLIAWDHDLKLAEMNGQGGFADESNVPFDLGLM